MYSESQAMCFSTQQTELFKFEIRHFAKFWSRKPTWRLGEQMLHSSENHTWLWLWHFPMLLCASHSFPLPSVICTLAFPLTKSCGEVFVFITPHLWLEMGFSPDDWKNSGAVLWYGWRLGIPTPTRDLHQKTQHRLLLIPYCINTL